MSNQYCCVIMNKCIYGYCGISVKTTSLLYFPFKTLLARMRFSFLVKISEIHKFEVAKPYLT